MIYYFDKVRGLSHKFTTGEYAGENYIAENIIKPMDYKDGEWIKKIGIIPILEDISSKVKNGNKPDKPSKFCLIACVRQESDDKFKEASIKTLKYAQDLSSVKNKEKWRGGGKTQKTKNKNRKDINKTRRINAQNITRETSKKTIKAIARSIKAKNTIRLKYSKLKKTRKNKKH